MTTTSRTKRSKASVPSNDPNSALLKTRQGRLTVVILAVLPVFLFLVSLALGRYQISLNDVGRILVSTLKPELAADIPETARRLVLRIRVPRILAALLVGGGLGVTGAAFQGIFKNPLVDSNILGVTSGAGFGAALALLLLRPMWQVQLSAFIFGMLAVALAFFGSRMYRSSPILVLTLMGILVGSLFNSLTSLLKYVADPLDTLPAITFWLLGSLTSITWDDIPILAAITVLGTVFLWAIRWRLNVLSLGDDEAKSLGMNPGRLKIGIIAASALVTAMAVSVAGVIGWVGLVIPHAGRIIVGPDHKKLIPASVSLGACFMLLIDDVSRSLLPGEVPIGVLTGILGVPILIVLLRKNRTGW